MEKRNFLFSIFNWIWTTVWGVLGPILRIGIRLTIIAAVTWLVLFAPFSAKWRDHVLQIAYSVWDGGPIFSSQRISDYDSLHCEKVRMRVAEAKKIKKRYEAKLMAKDLLVAGAAITNLIKGDFKSAGKIAARGTALTAKERYDLEKADAFLKGKIIDDLECFKPKKSQNESINRIPTQREDPSTKIEY